MPPRSSTSRGGASGRRRASAVARRVGIVLVRAGLGSRERASAPRRRRKSGAGAASGCPAPWREPRGGSTAFLGDARGVLPRHQGDRERGTKTGRRRRRGSAWRRSEPRSAGRGGVSRAAAKTASGPTRASEAYSVAPGASSSGRRSGCRRPAAPRRPCQRTRSRSTTRTIQGGTKTKGGACQTSRQSALRAPRATGVRRTRRARRCKTVAEPSAWGLDQRAARAPSTTRRQAPNKMPSVMVSPGPRRRRSLACLVRPRGRGYVRRSRRTRAGLRAILAEEADAEAAEARGGGGGRTVPSPRWRRGGRRRLLLRRLEGREGRARRRGQRRRRRTSGSRRARVADARRDAAPRRTFRGTKAPRRQPSASPAGQLRARADGKNGRSESNVRNSTAPDRHGFCRARERARASARRDGAGRRPRGSWVGVRIVRRKVRNRPRRRPRAVGRGCNASSPKAHRAIHRHSSRHSRRREAHRAIHSSFANVILPTRVRLPGPGTTASSATSSTDPSVISAPPVDAAPASAPLLAPHPRYDRRGRSERFRASSSVQAGARALPAGVLAAKTRLRHHASAVIRQLFSQFALGRPSIGAVEAVPAGLESESRRA